MVSACTLVLLHSEGNDNTRIRPDVFAVQQIPINESIPNHVLERLGESGGQNFVSVTRTNEEISIVYNATHAPIVDQSLAKWRCIKIRGPMDFGGHRVCVLVILPLTVNTKVLLVYYAPSQSH